MALLTEQGRLIGPAIKEQAFFDDRITSGKNIIIIIIIIDDRIGGKNYHNYSHYHYR